MGGPKESHANLRGVASLAVPAALSVNWLREAAESEREQLGVPHRDADLDLLTAELGQYPGVEGRVRTPAHPAVDPIPGEQLQWGGNVNGEGGG